MSVRKTKPTCVSWGSQVLARLSGSGSSEERQRRQQRRSSTQQFCRHDECMKSGDKGG